MKVTLRYMYIACSAGVFIGRARMVLIAKGLILLLSPIFLCHRIKDGGFIVAIRLTSFRPPKIRLHCRLTCIWIYICIDPFQVSQLVVCRQQSKKKFWTRKIRTKVKRNWPKTITVVLAMILSLILRCNNSRSFHSNFLLTTSDRSLYFVHF